MWRYDHGWVEESGQEGEALPPSLRIVTQNLWFDSHQREIRMQGHLRQWQELNPDIIALQEATLACLRPLLESEWIRAHYRATVTPDSPASWQGVVLFCRRRPRRSWITSLPGTMGRRLLNAEFEALRLGVVHLESTRGAADVRREQLEVVFSNVAEARDVLLVGDFNLCSSSPENQNLAPDYLDVWPALHPHEVGHTQDSLRNSMLYKQFRKHMGVRYDRMLLRSELWRAEAIEMVGTEPLGADLFASDHFGLCLELTNQGRLPKHSSPEPSAPQEEQ